MEIVDLKSVTSRTSSSGVSWMTMDDHSGGQLGDHADANDDTGGPPLEMILIYWHWW